MNLLVLVILSSTVLFDPSQDNKLLSEPTGFEEIDTGKFTIQMPIGWEYQQHQGIDSFVGEISNSLNTLSFDYSEMGYSWGLGFGEKEYIDDEKWIPYNLFQKKGTIYVGPLKYYNELMADKRQRMEVLGKSGIVKDEKSRIQPFPDRDAFVITVVKDQMENLNTKYTGTVTYAGETTTIPITVPKEYACNKISYSETKDFYIKLSEPVCEDMGDLGIYFKSKTSKFTFNLYTQEVPNQSDIEVIKKAFHTIQFVDNIH